MKFRSLKCCASLIFLGSAAALSGCSALGTLDTLVPNKWANKIAHIAFGPEPRQRLDIYLPDAPDERTRTILFFYGGAWTSGSREHYGFVASAFTEKGFAVVIPDYRLHPEITFPVFVEDAAEAYCWSQRNLSEYGLNGADMIVMGHSAGAHIAALLHYDERYIDATCPGVDGPRALVGLAGPYDFLPLVGRSLHAIFPAATRRDSQPINFVDGSEGPALLQHGLYDNRVKPRNSASLAEIVASHEGVAELKIYDELDHISMLLTYAPVVVARSTALDDALSFINQL